MDGALLVVDRFLAKYFSKAVFQFKCNTFVIFMKENCKIYKLVFIYQHINIYINPFLKGK